MVADLGLTLGGPFVRRLGDALLDLRKRPAEQVRGPKKAWYPALFVNFIGPMTYLRYGRRK